jgi:hypothetical protein
VDLNPQYAPMNFQKASGVLVLVNPPEESIVLGAIRLGISGSWSVHEFKDVLSSLDDVYQRLAGTMLLGDLVREEARLNEKLDEKDLYDEMSYGWSNTYYGMRLFDERRRAAVFQPFHETLEATRPLVAPLNVDAVRLESPGWVQLIGHLNPLKTIADFITKWRAENTKREQVRTKAAFDTEQANRKFAFDILSHLPETRRHEVASRLAEIAEFTITPSVLALNRLAGDSRVIDAEIVEPRAALPPVVEESPGVPNQGIPKRRIRLK